MAEQISIPLGKEEQELSKINEAYISLSKWLIGLSTGSIVFITGMSKPSGFWKWELALGLLNLIISILLGIKFVASIIDKSFFQLGAYLTHRYLYFFKNKDAESEYEFESNIKKVKDIVEDLSKDYSDFKDDIKKLREKHVACFLWQQRLFLIGIVMIALFGLFHI